MEFDYVIIGGGSSGCTLAARLSEDSNVTVCLLESGGESHNNVAVNVPALVPGALQGKKTNWHLETTPQPGLNGRRGYQPRGKSLGGSSAINGMVYIRGHRKDYDNWAEMGCEGWSYADVLPYFRKSENNERGANAHHGNEGLSENGMPNFKGRISNEDAEAIRAFVVDQANNPLDDAFFKDLVAAEGQA